MFMLSSLLLLAVVRKLLAFPLGVLFDALFADCPSFADGSHHVFGYAAIRCIDVFLSALQYLTCLFGTSKQSMCLCTFVESTICVQLRHTIAPLIIMCAV